VGLNSAVSIACLVVGAAPASAEISDGLQSETMLHPADGFTAYTFRRNEISFNQAIGLPGLAAWVWWGATDWLTVEGDIEATVGGVFEGPHYPEVSVDARIKIWRDDERGIAIAYESMLQHLWSRIDQVDEPAAGLVISRRGTSWFHHLNASQRIAPHLFVHLSAGFTFSEDLRIVGSGPLYVDQGSGGPDVRRARYHDLVTLDASASLDWRVRPWASLHGTVSTGSTFVYIDNVPRKDELCIATRIAPFYRSRHALLRTFRAELPIFAMYFPDARKAFVLAVPLFPYVYWQWQI